jgi:hypothetical protein
MGTITCKQIIDKVSTQLLDDSNTRWTRAELLGWLCDGQRAIVLIQPNASSSTSSLKLVSGTRQALPADGYLLLDVYRNMGPNGNAPGRAVRVVSREIVDAQDPYWHTLTGTGSVMNYIYDVQDTQAFYVYPPSNGLNTLEINYSRIPSDITDETQPIVISDVLQTALVDYILYRANSKDAEFAPGMQLASQYLQTFMAQMGKATGEEAQNSPNQSLGQGNAQPQPGATS